MSDTAESYEKAFMEEALKEEAQRLRHANEAVYARTQNMQQKSPPNLTSEAHQNTTQHSGQSIFQGILQEAQQERSWDTAQGACSGVERPTSVLGLDDTVCAEVAANFKALLDDVDFTSELQIFNLGLFSRTLRRTLLHELHMIYIGLWALALEQSFPQTAKSFFLYFVEDYVRAFKGAAKKQTQEKIFAYREMILRADAKDFNHISQHLLSFAKQNPDTQKADTLRLSLALRNHYTFIFQRLV